MGVENKPIAGIGIKIEVEDIYKYFVTNGSSEHEVDELIEELNEKFKTFEIVKAGSEYTEIFRYYIFIKDLFQHGVFNTDFMINKLVDELRDYITDEFFILKIGFYKDILVW